MRTFWIQTLGCKVNHYESEQLATVLRSFGLVQVESGPADLRIINSCSVTTEAASKSRHSARRAVRLPVLAGQGRSRVIVTGCWATSNAAEARQMDGVDAVLTHHDDVAAQLRLLLSQWSDEKASSGKPLSEALDTNQSGPLPAAFQDKGLITLGRKPAEQIIAQNRPQLTEMVKQKAAAIGTHALPLLTGRQSQHQRAFLKIQDGCDAHCTYCIIPSLRPSLWSKPIDDVLTEARQMVAAGHVEIVLTGIFLSAFGRSTALRRRQPVDEASPLASLIDALCTQVPGLGRLRLSSLEPGDLDDELIAVLRRHPQIVPHFHLPLQSGSDHLLHRMNRQYTRNDFLEMVCRVNAAFDRPALTTDIIVGFPGETDDEFERTIEIVEQAKFIHIHAFPFSPRPGTAAARWEEQFIHGPIVKQRLDRLQQISQRFSNAFREQFVGEHVQLLVERDSDKPRDTDKPIVENFHHGRCERYFDVHFESNRVAAGDLVSVRIDRVTPGRTFGSLVEILEAVPQ